MYSRKRSPYFRTVFLVVLVSAAFFFDVMFSTSRIPVFTTIVCGIVALYELVSPFIYAAR
jgi:hypothetical protein